jgi:hypothetical protein
MIKTSRNIAALLQMIKQFDDDDLRMKSAAKENGS